MSDLPTNGETKKAGRPQQEPSEKWLPLLSVKPMNAGREESWAVGGDSPGLRVVSGRCCGGDGEAHTL